MEDPRLWDPKTSFRFFAKCVVLPFVQPLNATLAGFDPGRTILLAQRRALGARMAQERLGFPLARVHLRPQVLRSVHQTSLFPH